jgi:hypothetical protein
VTEPESRPGAGRQPTVTVTVTVTVNDSSLELALRAAWRARRRSIRVGAEPLALQSRSP